MSRYLMTHSLLSSWLYAMKENPFEDSTSESDPMGEFMAVLRREPTPTNESMRKGIDFEELVTAITKNDVEAMERYDPKWFEAARKVAQIVSGGSLQTKAMREIQVDGIAFLLYGRLDALKAGVIYDIKFSGSYDRGKYISGTQHPTYLRIVPQASEFTYLISNGTEVWSETYRREETPAIEPIISDFISWLRANDLLELYMEKWLSA